MTESPRASVGRRRNGLQPACEPCRKAKVRCDISSIQENTCSRCKKRKDPTRCVVLEAPMTQGKRAAKSKSPTPLPVYIATPPGTLLGTPRSLVSNMQERFKDTSGYLGSTSFSATISPNQHEDINVELEAIEENPKFGSSERVMALQILNSIPDEETCSALIKWHLAHSTAIGMSKLTVEFILRAFWDAFRPFLKKPRTESDIERLASIISRNSHIPLDEPDDSKEWHRAFSGINTRWESIGVMLVNLAYGFMSLPDADFDKFPQSTTKQGRKSLIAEMKKSTESCMHLSRNSLNLVVLSMLHRNLLLETVINGDFCLSVWRLHHDMVAVATAIGLHAYQGELAITFRSEVRKRLSGCCFYNDKEIAMFTGRPPALSHRHYSCPLPFDISDEALMEGGDRLQREVDQLDYEGWSTWGEIHDATICRIKVTTAFIQDEVMEMFVGTASQFSMERVQEIKLRTQKLFLKEVPKMVHITKEYLASLSDQEIWRPLFARLDYLRIHFLLERLCVERGNEGKQNLLDVSREVVDLVVFLWLNRDRCVGRHHDFDYILMCYGMPSTGILCSELLKRTRQPKIDNINFPCSEVVQSLSLLIGFLEWIKPGAGNYKLCQRMARVLKRVLEQVFDPQLEVPTQPEDQAQLQVQDPNSSFWFPEGNDDFDWLNSIDWSKGMLMDLN